MKDIFRNSEAEELFLRCLKADGDEREHLRALAATKGSMDAFLMPFEDRDWSPTAAWRGREGKASSPREAAVIARRRVKWKKAVTEAQRNPDWIDLCEFIREVAQNLSELPAGPRSPVTAVVDTLFKEHIALAEDDRVRKEVSEESLAASHIIYARNLNHRNTLKSKKHFEEAARIVFAARKEGSQYKITDHTIARWIAAIGVAEAGLIGIRRKKGKDCSGDIEATEKAVVAMSSMRADKERLASDMLDTAFVLCIRFIAALTGNQAETDRVARMIDLASDLMGKRKDATDGDWLDIGHYRSRLGMTLAKGGDKLAGAKHMVKAVTTSRDKVEFRNDEYARLVVESLEAAGDTTKGKDAEKAYRIAYNHRPSGNDSVRVRLLSKLVATYEGRERTDEVSRMIDKLFVAECHPLEIAEALLRCRKAMNEAESEKAMKKVSALVTEIAEMPLQPKAMGRLSSVLADLGEATGRNVSAGGRDAIGWAKLAYSRGDADAGETVKRLEAA